MTRTLIIVTTFLSASLLFVVQPLYAKYLLPFFGGTATVWTISIFFYSTTLLLGYLYASLLTSWPSRTARVIHTSLLIFSGALLLGDWLGGQTPLLGAVVADGPPALGVFLALLHALGLPVLLLASTSVLAQHLFARHTKAEPYRLYAVSNAGSLIGLAAYPFFLEPFVSLSTQAGAWVAGFVVFLLLLQAVWRQVEAQETREVDLTEFSALDPLRHRFTILFLAAIPTFLLAATTEYLSQGISSFPLVWVVPLMLYLISFILAFSQLKMPIPNMPFGTLVLLSLIPIMALVPMLNANATMYWTGFGFFMLAFLGVCTYFHRFVYRLRPQLRDLGSFYVLVTLGGAIGSGVVAVLLPLVLDDAVEIYYALAVLLAYFTVRYAGRLPIALPTLHVRGLQTTLLLVVVVFLVAFVTDTSLTSERNFYGTLKVTESYVQAAGETVLIRSIINGATNHGFQAQDDRYRHTPTSYYGTGSGIGLAISHFSEQGVKPRVVVVGLGPGTIGAYCDSVSEVFFIDINPAVEQLAREYFTFLSSCADKVAVAEGDGRLRLRADNGMYDVIILDAFTDDAIPAHLLTTEAFAEAYLPRLSDQGMIAFHVSNKFLDLYQPIVGAARDNGYDALVINDRPAELGLQLPSSWVLVLRTEDKASFTIGGSVTEYFGKEIVWSDERSSIMQVLSLTGSERK